MTSQPLQSTSTDQPQTLGKEQQSTSADQQQTLGKEQQSTSADQPQTPGRALTLDNDLPELMNVLSPAAHQCINLGLQLGVKASDIANLKHDHRECKDLLREIITHRLKLLPPLTWHDIIEAVRSDSVQENNLASKIELKYTHQSSVLTSSQIQPDLPTPTTQTMVLSHSTGSASGSPRESPMAQYVRFVKTIYRSSEVERDLNVTKWPPTPSKVYTNLVFVEEKTVTKCEADDCTKPMVHNGSMDVILKKKRPIDFSDIAKNIPTSGKKVIVVNGAPGVGKSTFAWEFCRRWERGEIAQQYQLVLLIRLRDERVSKARNLRDLIQHLSKTVVKAMEHELIATLGDKTMIILEGFDELSIKSRAQSSLFLKLIEGQLPHATVLVTSRPWATQKILWKYHHRIFQHIEILGFTSKQIEEYVTGVLGNAKESVKEVMSYIQRYPQLKACMYIPLNSAIVVSVYQESKAGRGILPKTLTQLYYALIQILLLRYLYGHPQYGQRRWKIQSLKEDLPQEVYSKLLAISELAYSGISANPEGNVQLIYFNLPPDFETLGLMQSVPQMYVTQGEDVSYNFLHLTVQEFLAALHISNMSPEKQLEHFQRQFQRQEEEETKWLSECFQWQEEGRWRVVLTFLAGLTKLANLSPDLLRGLLLRKPKLAKPVLEEQNKYKTTTDADLIVHQVHWMFETQRDDIVSLVLQGKTVEFICYERLTPMDYYSLGYCISHSNSQWLLTVRGYIIKLTIVKKAELGEEEIKMLVAGANTKHDTTAKVVGLRSYYTTWLYDSSSYWPLSTTTKALNMLFDELKDMLYLKELYLNLPTQCRSISWPNLSGLQLLCLGIGGVRNWRLDALMPLPSLELFTVEPAMDNTITLLEDDCVAIGMLLTSSSCLKHLHFKFQSNWSIRSRDRFPPINVQNIETITKAMSDNLSLQLRSLVMEPVGKISNTAAHSLALFITSSTTLHHLGIKMCTFNVHGLLELAQAIHHSSSLQEKKLKYLTCTVDGDDEATQLLTDYPHMTGSLVEITASCISDSGVQFIATAMSLSHSSTLRELNLSNTSISDTGSTTLAWALHHNSTVRKLNLSNNSIGDTGSTALAQALHLNSALWELDLSNNSISDTGSVALAQALHHNSSLGRLDLSGSDAISEEGTCQLVQALTVNQSVESVTPYCSTSGSRTLVLPKRCKKYATQCPHYSEVRYRITFQ